MPSSRSSPSHASWLISLDRSEWTDPRLARTTFADWAIPWLDTRRHLKPKTLDGYLSLLTVHFLPLFGQLSSAPSTH